MLINPHVYFILRNPTLRSAPHHFSLSISPPTSHLPQHMDLLSILPSFPTKPYTHIFPPLERNNINTVDLITLDTLEIAKRAHVPPADVRRLSAQIVDALHHDVGFERDIAPEEPESTQSLSLNNDAAIVPGVLNRLDLSQWGVVSTLDPAMDGLLEGGIPAGYVTEVTGERFVSEYLVHVYFMVWMDADNNAVGAARRNSS